MMAGLGIPLSSFQESQHRVQHLPIPTFPLGFVQIHPSQRKEQEKEVREEGATWKMWNIGQISPKIQSGKDLDPVDTTGSGLGGSWDSSRAWSALLCRECSQVFPKVYKTMEEPLILTSQLEFFLSPCKFPSLGDEAEEDQHSR